MRTDMSLTVDKGWRLQSAFLLVTMLLLGLALVVLSPGAEAKRKFMSGFAEAFPSAAGTPLDSCILCHTDPVHPGEDNLNNYGEDWEDGDLGDKDYSAPELVNRDSDGDGITNGQEILQLSFPGDSSSTTPPTTTTTLAGAPPDGAALYNARCAVCHDSPALSLFGTSLPRTTFVNMTINGTGSMSAQGGTADEAGAIWDYVTGTTPTTTTTQPGGTTTTTQAAGGATVWVQHCAVCHGADGGNVVPTTLRKAQLVSVTTNGVGTMRGFPELGATQIDNVADYLLSLSAPPPTIPGATTTTTTPRSGATVYAASCALCHGANGGNLRGHTLSPAQIVAATTNGIGTMGGYAGRLSTAEINNVSQYVASVGANTGVTTTTAPPGSPVSGSTLYMQNCSACHGLHGEGGPGGAVAGTSLTRSQIISVTTNGTSGMTGYASQLSTEEISAIVDHILGMTDDGNSSAGTEDSRSGSGLPPELVEGHTLYGRFCEACHGVGGQGGAGGPVADTGLNSGAIEDIVRNGVGSMPGYADQMSKTEIEALVAYTEALATGADFDVQEVTTTEPRANDETLAVGQIPVTRSTGSGDEASEAGSPVVTIVAIVVGSLIAGAAAIAWMRAARNLAE